MEATPTSAELVRKQLFRDVLTDPNSPIYQNIVAIVVDESHTVETWTGKRKHNTKNNHAFRDAYGELAVLRSLCKEGVPVLALTGTADKVTMLSPDVNVEDSKDGWRVGRTAGGCRNNPNAFHRNPQFRVTLKDVDEDDDDDACTLIVSLIQIGRRKLRRNWVRTAIPHLTPCNVFEKILI